MKVSVIIPTLNEEKSIAEVIDSIPKDFAENVEIAIVDGLSTDRTVKIAKSKGARVIFEKRKGYGRAYKTGFKEAKGDIIVTLDGDLTYPAEKIPELVDQLTKEKLDFITCDRLSNLEQGVMSKKHKFGNWVLTFTTNLLFGIKIGDSQSGMWIFRKKILDQLQLTDDGMPLSEEIKIEAFKNKGVKAKEVLIEYRIRKGDAKISTWGDGSKNFKFLFKKRFGKRNRPKDV